MIGEAVSEKLDYLPATLKVIETRRPKYACRPCQGEMAVAPLPPSPIEQGMAAPGLLAHVLVSKFADHLPLNRQEAMLRRAGVTLPRSTLCDWVLSSAEGIAEREVNRVAADLRRLARACPGLADTPAGYVWTLYRARRMNAEAAARAVGRL